jgi:hypothetical protein
LSGPESGPKQAYNNGAIVQFLSDLDSILSGAHSLPTGVRALRALRQSGQRLAEESSDFGVLAETNVSL